MSFYTKHEATKAAKAAIERMETKGWKKRVWENLGWHAKIQSTFISIMVESDGTFWALATAEHKNLGAGELYWSDHYTRRDPNKVALHQLRLMEEYADKISSVVKDQLKALGLKKKGKKEK